MGLLEGELFVPLNVQGNLTGVIIIGPKQSQEAYTLTDWTVLATLASQVAVAVEKARLHTAQRRAEQQALEARTAATASRDAEQLKSAFLNLVSHDLRTPLATIKGTVAGLREVQDWPPALHQDLITVEQQTDRLHQVVTNLLDHSRLETGAALDLQAYALGDLLPGASEEVQPVLGERPFHLAVPADLPMMLVDGMLVQAVFRNLLLNVALHTPEGTSVTVRARAVTEARLPMVEIQVADQGPGIPAADRERAFVPFHRLSKGSRGSGLGLAIVQQVVTAHGGQVHIEETPGRGTTVVFTFPVAAVKQPMTPADVGEQA